MIRRSGFFFDLVSIANIVLLVGLAALPLFPFGGTSAQAARFTETYVRLDRLSDATVTGGTVCARPATVGTEADVQVVFPTVAGTDFIVNSTASNWIVNSANLPNGTTFWLGMTTNVTTATSVSGKTVTFPSGDLAVGTTYCFNFSGTNTLTTGAAGNNQTGTVTTRTGAAATIDSSGYALSVISDDQIVVSATVPATFSFALSANTDSLGTLSTTTASSSGVTATMTTNAASGWVAWVKSANAALSSVSASASIATAGSVDNVPSDLSSTTGYVLDVDITTDGGGTGTVTQAPNWGAEYAGANTTSGGTLSTAFQPIGSSSGTTDGDVLTLIERAKIVATQAAATDYTDTLTVVAAGRF